MNTLKRTAIVSCAAAPFALAWAFGDLPLVMLGSFASAALIPAFAAIADALGFEG